MSSVKGLVTKVEGIIGGWLKGVPHLPAAGQKWLGENVWWIVLVGVVLSAFGIIALISSLFAAFAFFGNPYRAFYAAPLYSSWFIITVLVSIAFYAVSALVLSLAIKPLKAGLAKGWRLLLIALLVQAAYVAVNTLLSITSFGFIGTLVFGAVGLAIGAYFVFEIRSHFIKPAAAADKKAPAKKKPASKK